MRYRSGSSSSLTSSSSDGSDGKLDRAMRDFSLAGVICTVIVGKYVALGDLVARFLLRGLSERDRGGDENAWLAVRFDILRLR